MLFQRKQGVSWIIVCLGNPGQQYENTRHNVGFLVADELGERLHIPIQQLKFKALTHTCSISGEKVLLMKPITYMNRSGESVRLAVDFYRLEPSRVLVISDDTALSLGRLRLRRSGSSGGHNGLKSIIEQVGSDHFPRIRIGVGGKPHPDYDMVQWVLGSFSPEEKILIKDAVGRAASAAECIMEEGIDQAMNRFNSAGSP